MSQIHSGIKECLSNIEKGGSLNKNDVFVFFAYLRQFLEESGKQDSYKYLKFYCDWLLHPEINNMFALKIMEDINSALILRDEKVSIVSEDEFKEKYSPNTRVPQILGLDLLRGELISALTDLGLDSAFFHSCNCWKALLSLVLGHLKNKPLKFRESRRKKEELLHNDIKQLATGATNIPVLELKISEAAYYSSNTSGYVWVITKQPENIDLVGSLLMPEHRYQFKYD